MLPIQGATIFGDLSAAQPTHGSTILDNAQAPAFTKVREDIAANRRDVSEALKRLLQNPVASPVSNAPSSASPAPLYWIIYNRWTGKYIGDVHGNETPNVNAAYRFASDVDATQCARSAQNTAFALAQPPPEGEYASCGWCDKHYPIGTVECTSCLVNPHNAGIESMIRRAFHEGIRSWVYMFSYNAAGQSAGAGQPL